MVEINTKLEKNSKDNNTKATMAVEEKPTEALVQPKEIGGPKGLEPTRYGDWMINGRVSDF